MKKITFLGMALIFATQLIAYDCYIGGIYYDLNSSNHTAGVTKDMVMSILPCYSGKVSIPSSITYNSHTYSVTNIGYGAFFGCTDLTSVTIPNSVTMIGDGAFDGCYGLTSVTIPNSVTTIENNAFHGCRSLTSITIPHSVKTIGDQAFNFCYGLTSVTIPNSVTTIGERVFANCSGLTFVTIPNTVTTIGNYVFIGCTGLQEVVYNTHIFARMPTSYKGAYTIPNGITQIAGGAFEGCDNLTSLTIPSSVDTIGLGAFNGCKRLTSLTCYATTPPSCSDCDYFILSKSTSTPVYVPTKSVRCYKQANGWNTLNIRPLLFKWFWDIVTYVQNISK